MKNNFLKLFLVCLFFVFNLTEADAFSFRNITMDFVQVSDTHITERADTSYKALSSSKALLSDIIDQINDIKGLDFVLFSGDLTDSGTYENYTIYYQTLKALKYPSLNAFGNHDFYGGLGKEEVLKIVQENNPNYTFNDTYWAISPKTDYRIIVLDSTIKDENTAQGYLSKEQLEFLDSELEQNQDKVVVISMHHPSVQPFVAKEHEIVNADEFNEILLKYNNPIVVLTGHYHAAKIRHFGNLVFVSTPAMVTYPMAARHIKITNFSDRVYYKFDFLPTRLDDVKEKNRQSVISYSLLAGLEKDRNQEFTFYKKHPRSAKYKRNKIIKANSAKRHKASKRELKKLTQPSKKELKQETPKKEKIKKEKVKKEKIKKEKPQKAKKEKIKKRGSKKVKPEDSEI